MSALILSGTSERRSQLGSKPIVFTVAATLALAVAAAFQLHTGAPMEIAFAISICAAPLALLLSLRRPLIFPFALYCFVVPFNNLVYFAGMGTLTKLIGGVALVALALYIVRKKDAVRPPVALFAWMALILWACTSMIWSIDQAQSWSLVPTLLQLFVLYAIVAVTPATLVELRAVLVATAVGGIAAAAYGAYVFIQGSQTQDNRLFLESAGNTDTLDPNHFGASLLLPLAIVVTAVLNAKRLTWKLLLLGGAGVLMMGMYASASRGAFTAVAALVIYLLWKSRGRIQLLLVALVAAVASLAVPTALWSRITADTSGSGRTAIWTIGLDAFRHYWLFGAGVANFSNAYDESFLRFYEPLVAKWSTAPHNILFMIGVELGIVGLVFLVWAIVAQFRMLRHIEPGDALYEVRIGLEAAFAGLLVGALALDVLYWKYAWLTFMVMAVARSASLTEIEDAAIARPASRASVPTWNGMQLERVIGV